MWTSPQLSNYFASPYGQTGIMASGELAKMGTGGVNGGFFNPNNTNFGWNANTLNFGMQGLMGLGNLWGAWQSNKLARDQLNFTKDFANRNLANQTKAYNTALEDRGRTRAFVEGQTSAEAQAYIDRNRLKG